VAKRDLENLTMGVLRDILRRFHEVNHPAAKRLLNVDQVEQLQILSGMRNRLAHGELVNPDDIMRALVPLARFISGGSMITFVRPDDR
jgi:hypothetical protein